MYPTIGGREPGPHMPRRLKGRLEVQRELRLYHHPAPKYTLCRSKSRTLCIGMHQLVLHWVQGRCIALRNVRTLGDFSATVVLRHYCHGRTLPTASGTLQLEKSVISCSTAPQLHSSTDPQLHSSGFLSNSKAPTSLLAAQSQAEHADVHRSAFNLISVALCPEFLEPSTSLHLSLSYLHFWTWLV